MELTHLDLEVSIFSEIILLEKNTLVVKLSVVNEENMVEKK